MKIVKAIGIAALGLAVIGGLVWQFWLKGQVDYARIATAYGAKMVCSCRFVAARPMESCLTDFTTDISMVSFEETETAIRASVLGGLVSSEARNTGPGTGCTLVEK
ncbi:MAG: hypothetical protein FP825_13140 [Hyphomonas sp.]|uniref:hypothetical protein n=1 Tax=Hyphomonas sp. TaxID=87 RepID=UPI001814D051|nr:hypothetical protein [Hyphomonas sp.]MBU3920576.1 hypothetical protein [Alphaproteobacteria bacterium]MBA3069410.1 hypothetical protein [Hyphomonas sp.]MBU4063792.1 hypothetical protein [Alphaproteobacteria bacterium]MBU4164247.1 hypothetical protein [Alphaproteobacteria bacterium]MBU4569089.1 hypothetical protein [Alphaproteobacteria bacterium]